MNLAEVDTLYATASTVGQLTAPIELVAVSDIEGARLDGSVRQLEHAVQENPEHWADLLMAARQLRWRRATEPQPTLYGIDRSELLRDIIHLCKRGRIVADTETSRIIDELGHHAESAALADNPVGEILIESIEEIGRKDCSVLLGSARAAEGVRQWFDSLGLRVDIGGGRGYANLQIKDQCYCVGNPAIFGLAHIAAPRAHAISHFFPSWLRNTSLPRSEFSRLARGGLDPSTRIYHVGEDASSSATPEHISETIRPEPLWPLPAPSRVANSDEVIARQVMLSGGRSMWLDQDGGWIRILDPLQPAGDRVHLRDERTVAPGTFLILREGATESDALYARSIALLGPSASSVTDSQAAWKSALASKLRILGQHAVVTALECEGVRAASRAPFWTAPTVVRPQADSDFIRLLGWLGLNPDVVVPNANRLRKARSQAATRVREALEDALDRTDLDYLLRQGHVRLDLDLEGFAGIIATRVLAVSPHQHLVPRNDVRIASPDRTAKWLE